MPSFMEIANKKLDDVVKAPLPPVGTYKFIVTKIPEARSQGDQWDVVDVHCRAVEAREDVDPDAAAAYGDVSKIQLRKSFMFDKNDAVAFQNTENNLKRFLAEHLKCCSPEDSFKKAFNESVNCPFLGEVVWRPGKGDQEGEFFANIGKTAPVG